MILRGGKQPKGLKEDSSDELLHYVNVENVENELSVPSKNVNDDNVVPNCNKVPKDPKYTSPKPDTPPLPFSQRIRKAKLDLQYGKFLKSLRNSI